jgi:hypothetical protein
MPGYGKRRDLTSTKSATARRAPDVPKLGYLNPSACQGPESPWRLANPHETSGSRDPKARKSSHTQRFKCPPFETSRAITGSAQFADVLSPGRKRRHPLDRGAFCWVSTPHVIIVLATMSHTKQLPSLVVEFEQSLVHSKTLLDALKGTAYWQAFSADARSSMLRILDDAAYALKGIAEYKQVVTASKPADGDKVRSIQILNSCFVTDTRQAKAQATSAT